MSTMEQALRDALADLLTEAGYMAQQLAHRGLPGVPGDSVDRAIASAKAALTAALPAPGVEAPGDYTAGFRAGIEAAAKVLENRHVGGTFIPWDAAESIADAIYAIAPSAPAEISQAQAMREALQGLLEIDGWDKTHPRYVAALAALPPEPPR